MACEVCGQITTCFCLQAIDESEIFDQSSIMVYNHAIWRHLSGWFPYSNGSFGIVYTFYIFGVFSVYDSVCMCVWENEDGGGRDGRREEVKEREIQVISVEL